MSLRLTTPTGNAGAPLTWSGLAVSLRWISVIASVFIAMSSVGAEVPLFAGATRDYRAWVAAKLPGNPEGLAIDAAGRIYATIYKTGEVVRLDGKGGYEHIATVPSEELGRAGLTAGAEFDRSGNLYVAYVWHYSADEEMNPLHTGCRDSRDIYTGIYKINPETRKVTPVLTKRDGWPTCFPDDIAIDHKGNLYITDLTLSGIWKIAPDGTFLLWSADPLLQWPPSPYYSFPEGANDLVLDKNEKNLYVVTDGDPAIIRVPINNNGSPGKAVIIARDLTPLDGVELDEYGNIFVSEIVRSEVSIFSPDGAQRIVIATHDTAPITNAASLIYRNGVLCMANMGYAAKLEPRSVACVSGFRRPATGIARSSGSPGQGHDGS
jgi:sugar lactone lactonase YvrE